MSSATTRGDRHGDKWRQARQVVSSRNFLLLLIGLETFVCMVLLWAIYCGAEISSGPDNWICIRSSTSRQLTQLQKEFEAFKSSSVSKDTYDELQRRITDLERTTINIGLLPGRLQGSDPEEVLKNIKSLVLEVETLPRDISFSMAVVSREITACGIINTKQPVSATIKRLNSHILACLQAIGFYDGNCDGERENTHNAVLKFQQARGLNTDGLLGRKTWMAITALYEQLSKES